MRVKDVARATGKSEQLHGTEKMKKLLILGTANNEII